MCKELLTKGRHFIPWKTGDPDSHKSLSFTDQTVDLMFFICVALNFVQTGQLEVGHSPVIVFHVNIEPGHLAATVEERELAPGNDWKVCYEAVKSGHEID